MYVSSRASGFLADFWTDFWTDFLLMFSYTACIFLNSILSVPLLKYFFEQSKSSQKKYFLLKK